MSEDKFKENINDSNKEIDLQSNSLDKASKSLEKFGSTTKKVGELAEKFGKSLNKHITKHLMDSVKIGVEFEASMTSIKASINPTEEELSKLERKAREIGLSTSKTAKDISDTFGKMGISGWSAQDMLLGIEPIIHLAETGNIDLARSSDLVTKAMNTMEISIKDLPNHLDIIAKSAQVSSTGIDEMMESFISVESVLKNLKIDSIDGATGLALLASQGEKGAKGGKLLASILTSLTSPTDKAKKALEDLNFTAFDSNGKFIGIENSIKSLNEKMAGMTDESKNMYISMIVGKEHISGLNMLLKGASEDGFANFKKSIYENDNALEKMGDLIQNNVKGNLTELNGSISELGIKIYDVLRPTIANIIEVLQKWIDKLNNLTPEQQKTIVNIVKFVAVAGPLLMIVGKLISGIGGITLNFSMLSGAAAASGTTIAAVASGFVAAAVPVIATIAVITAVVAGVGFGLYKLNKHLKESSLEIEVFDDSISDATKNSVESFLELDKEASKSLLNLKANSREITKETADNMVSQYENMTKTVIDKLAEQKEEAQKTLNDLYTKNTNLDQSDIDERLKQVAESYDKEIEDVQAHQNTINDIVKKGLEEKRKLSDEELMQIEVNKDKIKEAGIVTLSETAVESKLILQRLKDQKSEITTEMVAETVKSSLEQKDKAVENAQKEYEEIVKIAEQLRARGGEENEARANETIAFAQLAKNEATKEAEEMHENVVKEAKLQAQEHVDYVDWETGETLSKWEKWNVDQKKKADERRVRQEEYIEGLKAMVKGKGKEIIDGIKEDGVEISNWFKGYSKRVIDDFKEMGKGLMKTGKQNVKDMINDMKSFKDDMAKVGEQLMDGLKEGIAKFVSKPVNAIKDAGEKIKSKAKSVFNIHSPSKVFAEDGKYLMEGWAVGIEKNSKIAEDALIKAAETLKATSSDLTIAHKMNFSSDNLKANTSSVFSKNKSLDDYSDYLRKLNADELDITIKHLEEMNKAREKALNKQIDSTQNNKSKANFRAEKKALSEHNNEIKKLIDDRVKDLDEQSQKEANILKLKENQYEESIKRLKIETNDLEDELSNNAAIVIIQAEKVEYLSQQYSKLVDSFGFMAKESINVKNSLESARIELIKMQEDVEKTNEKIINNTMDSINNLHQSMMSALKKRYEEEGKIKEESLQKEIDDLDKWKNESIKRINDVYDNRIKRIDEVANAQIKAIEDELKSMDKDEMQKSRNDISNEYDKNINDLQESILYEHDEYNKAELEKRLAEEKAKFKEQQENWVLEDKKAKLKENIDIIKENAAEEKEILATQKQEELERIDNLYTFEREVLESKMKDNRDFLQQMTDDKQLQAEAEKMILNTQQQDMLDLLKQYEPGYEKAGYNLGQKLVDGVAPQIQKVIDMMNYMYMTLGLDNHITIADHIRVQDKHMKEFRPPEVKYRDSSNLFGDNDYKLPEKTINNTVNFNSPKALDPSEQRKLTERQLNRLSFNI